MHGLVERLFSRREPLTLVAHFVLTALFTLAICLLYFGFAYLNKGP